MNTPQILQQLNGRSLKQMLPQIKQLVNMVRSSGNPQAMLYQMLQQNPNYGTAMRMVEQANGDYDKAFYNLANQMGIDPQEIFEALK